VASSCGRSNLIIRLIRYGLALFLLFLAVVYPFAIYAVHAAMASIFGDQIGVVMLLSDLEAGAWIFFVASGIAIAGAIGLFRRKPWGRVLSMLAFGLFALVELIMAISSPEQAQSLFSFSEQRRPVVIAAVLFCAALGWLLLPLAKEEFQTNGSSQKESRE
jgi:hypothetical protein